MATKPKLQKKKIASEIYIRITVGEGKTKDTIAHSVETKEAAIVFLNTHL